MFDEVKVLSNCSQIGSHRCWPGFIPACLAKKKTKTGSHGVIISMAYFRRGIENVIGSIEMRAFVLGFRGSAPPPDRGEIVHRL